MPHDEAVVVARARQGDQGALVEIYERVLPPRRCVNRWSKSPRAPLA